MNHQKPHPEAAALTPRPTASAKLAATLRDRILEGSYVRGESLREEHLAAEFGLSRHTVRTALATLASERLVHSAPYKGVEVTNLDDAEIRAMQDLRCALESEAVRILNSRHPDGWPDEVRAPILAQIARLRELEVTDAHSWRQLEAAHAAVHQAIIDTAGSPRISETARSLESEVRLLLAGAHEHYGAKGLAEDHERYLTLLEHDGPTAVRAHLDALTAHLLAGSPI
ncbi:GntR family transcriptional regulator [Pseudoclavibacter sp. VKM Ac-2867]|uniref:GntR family transcriptional regulator n=1 Tax=Pseudoclavibacter sp. VKM Ac-2867 TaxID=2783829 RepID=UPI00188C1DF1|nr:GntR family transcriptional regulator [Pseudoclavibacter sp. VKM Ac-2867]MBF4459674.1 GntR family transcriptional regulator [Pseudoclavibacter sp. VKM Ac-2867]